MAEVFPRNEIQRIAVDRGCKLWHNLAYIDQKGYDGNE
jgi:hypothetical protein